MPSGIPIGLDIELYRMNKQLVEDHNHKTNWKKTYS